jgi:hypothetical protein
MKDGVSYIEIHNAETGDQSVTIPDAVVPSGSGTSYSTSVNWYEVIKIILLAAIIAVVIPKPAKKKQD